MILAIIGEKGGSGKSCIAQNLAVLRRRRGHRVLLLDADPHRNTVEWGLEREQNTTLISLHVEEAHGDIRPLLLDRARHFDTIIVDVAGADSDAMRAALAVATHVLLPFRPKRRDLRTLPNMAAIIGEALEGNPELIVRSVITQVNALPSQVKRLLDAKDICASYGLNPLQAFTVNRNVYDDADEDGASVLEFGADRQAIEEIEMIAAELWPEAA